MWHRDQLEGEGLPNFAWDDFLLGQKFYHLDDEVILSASTFAKLTLQFQEWTISVFSK